MSLYIKKHWSKGAKIAGAVFFAAIMFVNIKLTTDPNVNGDIDLFGLKMSLFTPSAIACSAQENHCPGSATTCDTHTIVLANGDIIIVVHKHNYSV